MADIRVKRSSSLTTRADYVVDAQWGVTYREGADPSPLVFPFLAEWTCADTCLVIDRRKVVNRLVEVSRGGDVIWSMDLEPRANFAHRLDRDTVLYTQGNSLWSVDAGGRVEHRCSLPSPEPINCGSIRGHVVALASDAGIDLVNVDGRHLAHLPPSQETFVEPYDLELLASGGLLVTDVYGMCVVELDARGRRTRTFSPWRAASLDPGYTLPAAACRLADGRTMVADWRTHAIVEYDEHGRLMGLMRPRGRAEIFAPAYVRETRGGELVVTETGNRRVTLRSPEGEILWEFGSASLPERTLSFSRSVQALDSGDLVVCDTYANRVVVLGEKGDERWAVGGDDGAPATLGLTLPRSACRNARGELAIADGYNSRVVVVDARGRVCREVHKVWNGGYPLTLEDPHHAVLRNDDGLLMIVDSDRAEVLLIDEQDNVVTRWGSDDDPLSDPHQALLLPDGGVLVADSGNNRIVELDRTGRIRWRAGGFGAGPAAADTPFDFPRFAGLLDDGSVLVADTNACRILHVDRETRLLGSIGPALDVTRAPAVTPELRVPKWVALDRHKRILVSDYYNCRIVAFSKRSDGAASAGAG